MFNNIEGLACPTFWPIADGNLNVARPEPAVAGCGRRFRERHAVLVYQEAISEAGGSTTVDNGDFKSGEMFGISVGTTFGGADVRLAYAQRRNPRRKLAGPRSLLPDRTRDRDRLLRRRIRSGDANFGRNVAYEDGPTSVALDYADEQGTEIIGLEGSYDVGNGLVAYAGILTEDAGIVSTWPVKYDLGSVRCPARLL